jgi:hypothetical protein
MPQTRCLPALVALSLAPASATQEPPSGSSLASGLIRQLIDVQQLEIPRLLEDLDPGAGKDPLALLVVKADGTWQLESIERGRGNRISNIHEAPDTVDPVEEQAEADAQSKPAADEDVIEDGNEEPRRAVLPIRLTRTDEKTLLQIGAAKPEPLPDGLEQLHSALRSGARERADERKSRTMSIDVALDVPVQDLLTVCAAGKQLGLGGAQLQGKPGGDNDIDLSRRLRKLGTELGWDRFQDGDGNPLPMFRGELLLLLDGPQTWGDVQSIYMACATSGIWQISFVGRTDAHRCSKLRVNLPVDRGVLR